MASVLTRDLPSEIAALGDIALDLRWTWSHEADALWQRLDEEVWTRTQNPWTLLQDVSADRLRAAAADPAFAAELQRLAGARTAYLSAPGWFSSRGAGAALGGVAYFSMEFGLGEALPLYAGGLGVLAGDYLKTASDLGMPAFGIGLLYREGYFRQVIGAAGWQRESYPFNDPGSMPIRPVRLPNGAWLHIPLDLPGRRVLLRVWQAQVGRVALYLLDANDPMNDPADRGITGRLYESDPETRLLQALALGVGGWRVVQAIAPEAELCHLNEGHAAFAVIERARSFCDRTAVPFQEALWATRAGNIFTTHTPVAAGFDCFPPALVMRYLATVFDASAVPISELLALGRADPADRQECFNMAYLAMRGSRRSIGVSRQHGEVSRRIFERLYPRWPQREIPVGHVTNGVHMPSWDSPEADHLWTAACGKERWRAGSDIRFEQIAGLNDVELWAMRAAARQSLVRDARRRLRRQLGARGAPPEDIAAAEQVLDPNILTLGFARRFTAYKRPNLMLHDLDRLRRLLIDDARPCQLIVAGKAHPADDDGKRMIRDWVLLERERQLRRRLVFLEDYDLTLAQELVQGVDVWINTPRRPWEACGTSGMKVLVNGGLNLSVLDGWWEEAYAPEFGWAVGGDDAAADAAGDDSRDAAALYELLEQAIVPEFYARDAAGIPRRWLARVRSSLSRLTPAYSSNRMLHEYVEKLYLPAAREFGRRTAGGCAVAAAMRDWEGRLSRGWPQLHIGEPAAAISDGAYEFSVAVYLGGVGVDDVAVELYAEPQDGAPQAPYPMERRAPIPGSSNGHIYGATAPGGRPASDYTVRIFPAFPGVNVPGELSLILWQK